MVLLWEENGESAFIAYQHICHWSKVPNSLFFLPLFYRIRLILSGWCGFPPSGSTSCLLCRVMCCSPRSAPCWRHRCFYWLINWLSWCMRRRLCQTPHVRWSVRSFESLWNEVEETLSLHCADTNTGWHWKSSLSQFIFTTLHRSFLYH